MAVSAWVTLMYNLAQAVDTSFPNNTVVEKVAAVSALAALLTPAIETIVNGAVVPAPEPTSAGTTVYHGPGSPAK